jgi:TRAP-type mannitol/chloroaromatic compound transport system substrate-binding protein
MDSRAHPAAMSPASTRSAMSRGAFDASAWVGRWLDMAMGLHKAAGYYYYPGFHEPGTGTAEEDPCSARSSPGAILLAS